MNLTKLFDLRLWFLFFGMVFTIVLALSGWAKLPKKVEAITKQTVENKKSLGKTNSNLDKYIAVNEEYKAQQMEQKTIMIDLMKALAK